MKKSIWSRLIICFLLAGVITFLLLNTYGMNLLEKRLRDNKLDLMYKEADLISSDLFDNEDEIEKFRDSLEKQLDWIYGDLLGTPLAVEEKFENEELIEGLPGFSGTMDRIDGTVESRILTLKDYKTGKVYTKKQLANNIQATIYSLYVKKKYGFYPSHFVFLFSKFKKEKTVFITEDYINQNTEYIKEIWNNILNQNFNPLHNRSKFFCNNFCNYKPNCIAYTKVPKGWENVGN